MKPFTEHPASVGETYFQHMRCSFSFGWKMLTTAGACFLHGLFPFLFTKYGSETIAELHDCMVVRRKKYAKDKKLPNVDCRGMISIKPQARRLMQ